MGYGDWSSYIFQGAPQAKPKTRRLHRQKKKQNSVWSSLFKKLIVLMISQADLEDLWIRLRGSEALQWQMAACLLPPGNVLNCLQWKVLKVDLIWVGIQASMRFIWTLFSHVMQEQRRERDLAVGLISFCHHLWCLNSASVQPPPCASPQGLSNNTGESININNCSL